MSQDQDHKQKNQISDLFIIGGGINGCGIARDASGRGLSVTLVEMNDLASATSSASTKLFHGGLRYLEYLEIRLVREALKEREVLLSAMPHISWPMRFVLPYHKDMRFEGDSPVSRMLSVLMPWAKGSRPAWLIRLGLFLYDNLARTGARTDGRTGGKKSRQILPSTSSVNLKVDAVGTPLQDRLKQAYEYSDCWIDDARLVVLNARDAKQRGANIRPRCKAISAKRIDGLWEIETQDQINHEKQTFKARMLVNAGGPWVKDIINTTAKIESKDGIRLVRGSHIVTKKLFDHDKSYIFQGEDGRIMFAIPYETDFTLIGTTDVDHQDAGSKPECTKEEIEYICTFVSKYFKKPVTPNQVVWSYSGVRPLYSDESDSDGNESAKAATRDYTLKVDQGSGEDSAEAPLLNIFGGKITTYRRLAESALEKIAPFFSIPDIDKKWTAGVPLPGGDFAVNRVEALTKKLINDYSYLSEKWAQRLIKSYGTDAHTILLNSTSEKDLGKDFGGTLTEREVDWLRENEFAHSTEDIIWRRSKLGLHMSIEEVVMLDEWIRNTV